MRDARAVTATPVRIPTTALVVLVGPSGSGKSTWAESHFRPDQIVSSDALRSLVGTGEHDQRAGTDAFDVLHLVVDRRLKRGLLTVLDSLGLDDKQRSRWIRLARDRDRPVVAVAFHGSDKDFRARNKARPRPVPSAVITAQLKRWAVVQHTLLDEFDEVLSPGHPHLIPSTLVAAPPAAARQQDSPVSLTFGLQIPSFTWPGGSEAIGPTLKTLATEAEAAGFDSLWVMDHLRQIPQVGRDWDPMLESYTTLGFLAAATERIQLGTMVTGVTYRNVGLLAKTIATLDVLSGGRAMCGIGAAWFEKEHRAYGWEFPSNGARLDLLEEALQALPLLWGPGSPSFEGEHLQLPDTTCYPRPLQDPVPILVGGGGEKRTLRLVAKYANACNLFGEPADVKHKVSVLDQHCSDVGRDRSDISVTQLSSILIGADGSDLDQRVNALTGPDAIAEEVIDRTNAGTIDDHIGRFRLLSEAGVDTAIVSLADLTQQGAIANAAKVIAAFS